MKIISFDCANKSLGVSIIEYNDNWRSILNSIINAHKQFMSRIDTTTDILSALSHIKQTLEHLQLAIDDIFSLKYGNVFDLIPNMKVKNSDIKIRSSRLKGALNYIDNIFIHIFNNAPIDKILIENQMAPNDKSHEVASKIYDHYTPASYDFAECVSYPAYNIYKQQISRKTSVELIGGSLKQKLSFSRKGRLSNFIVKYASNYGANKAHSKFNFLIWIKTFKLDSLIIGIPQKNLDDIADSFLMALAYIKKYHWHCCD